MEIKKLSSPHTLVTLILSCILFSIKGTLQVNAVDHLRHYYPDRSVSEYRLFAGGSELSATSTGLAVPRRELTAAAPFQLCLQCQCCAAAAAGGGGGINDPGKCEFMPCCFSIDCNLPNKPYGVCAFLPKSCNCTSCAN